MNKKERLSVLTKLKPQTWYLFCQFEAMHDPEIKITKIELATKLNISINTLTKYFAIWESHGLIRTAPGGLIVISQLDGTPSGVKLEPANRRYKSVRDLINFWCITYENYYHQPYTIANWAVAANQVKKLLVYKDEEIEGAIEAVIAMYDKKWASARYPRPTLGSLGNFLFTQALPYADTASKQNMEPDNDDDLLKAMEEKGWL